ncbi:unnamed protein product [Amoebophrya sp. A25]|nr:unnamed protein product [Amoebophrya sp. A25]|eukprot:GSA25T00001436001.1
MSLPTFSDMQKMKPSRNENCSSGAAAATTASARAGHAAQGREQTLQLENTVTFRRVATFRSPFHTCFGCPRQGAPCPNTRGRIELADDMSGDFFRGIEAFSHVWVLFLFDRNGSKAVKQEKASSSSSSSSSGSAGGTGTLVSTGNPEETSSPTTTNKNHNYLQSNSKALVRPPRLGDHDAAGIFATRAPHRPNAIGMTVMKIEKVEGRTLLVSGVDVVDGTFVVDIKPYHVLDAAPVCRVDPPMEEEVEDNSACSSSSTIKRRKTSSSDHDITSSPAAVPSAGGQTQVAPLRVAEKMTQLAHVPLCHVQSSSSSGTVSGTTGAATSARASASTTSASSSSSTTCPATTTTTTSSTTSSTSLQQQELPAVEAPAHFPQWCVARQRSKRVTWTEEALAQLKKHSSQSCKFYSTVNSETELTALQRAVEEVVSLDMRTWQHKKKKKERNTTTATPCSTAAIEERKVWAFYYDSLNILFRIVERQGQVDKDKDTDNQNVPEMLGFEIFLVEPLVDGKNTCWMSVGKKQAGGG